MFLGEKIEKWKKMVFLPTDHFFQHVSGQLFFYAYLGVTQPRKSPSFRPDEIMHNKHIRHYTDKQAG